MKKSSSVSILDLQAAQLGDATATLGIRKRKISEGDDRILLEGETNNNQQVNSDDCNNHATKNYAVQEKSACSTSLSDQTSTQEKAECLIDINQLALT